MWCFRWEVVARIITGCEGVVGLRIGTRGVDEVAL